MKEESKTMTVKLNKEIVDAAVSEAAHNLVMLDPMDGESKVEFTERRLRYFLTGLIQRGAFNG